MNGFKCMFKRTKVFGNIEFSFSNSYQHAIQVEKRKISFTQSMIRLITMWDAQYMQIEEYPLFLFIHFTHCCLSSNVLLLFSSFE